MPAVPDVGNFGFYHPREWVEDWYWKREKFGILPGPGGWMDQLETIRQDIDRYEQLHIAATIKVRKERESNGTRLLSEFPGLT